MVAHAELFAVVIAAMKANLLDPIPCVEFVTDASYVCKIIRLIELGLVMPILHKLTNSELIFKLATMWHKDKFKVIKVKSHRKFEPATDRGDLWTIAGNHCADLAAEAANTLVPREIQMLVNELVKHVENEKMTLRDHCHYLVDLNVKRGQLIDALKDRPVSTLIRPRQEAHRDFRLFDSHAMGQEALDEMLKFHPPDYVTRPGVQCEDEVFHMCLQGADIAKTFKISVTVSNCHKMSLPTMMHRTKVIGVFPGSKF